MAWLRTLLVSVCALLAAPAFGQADREKDLGLSLRPDPARHGYLVLEVAADSVAEAAGIRRGDVLVEAMFAAPPVTLCPEEPYGPQNLRQMLDGRATHVGWIRPDAPEHLYFQRADLDEAAAEVERLRRERERRRQREEREAERREPRSGPAPKGEGERRAATGAAHETVRLKPAEITDPALNGLVSHTLLVPAGWTVSGNPIWNLGTATNLATLDVTVRDETGEQIRFFPNEVYTWADSPAVQQQMGARPGQRLPTGVMFAAPPRSIEQHVVRDVMPLLRPRASGVRVVSAEPLAEVKAAYEEIMAPLIQQAQRMDAEGRQMGTGRTSVEIDCGIVRVAYTEGGRSYEEDVYATVVCTNHLMSGQGMMPDVQTASWQRMAGSSVRAEAGRLDALRPVALSVAQSLRTTRQWSAVYAEMQKQLSAARHRATMEQMRQQQQALARDAESLSDIHYEGWKQRQASEDRMRRSYVNSIHEVDDFVRTDGTSVSLPDGYRNVYYSPTEGYLLTNDELTQPNVDFEQKNWQPVRRAEP